MSRSASEGAVFVVGDEAPVACVFCRAKGDVLYLGKLAVAQTHRGRGLARALVAAAETEARRRGLDALELQTRVELAENHAAFARLGFVKTGETAHAGFDRATSITMRRTIARPRRVGADYPHWPAVLGLISEAFAYMDARVGQPSPAHRLNVEALADGATEGAAFVIEAEGAPIACVFSRPSRDVPEAFYLGRLAVDARHRGRGFARLLVEAVETEARRRRFAALVLDTSVALPELHAAFARLGFRRSGEEAGIVTMLKAL
jgi:GNAT superfamily N-acetyltransferase